MHRLCENTFLFLYYSVDGIKVCAHMALNHLTTVGIIPATRVPNVSVEVSNPGDRRELRLGKGPEVHDAVPGLDRVLAVRVDGVEARGVVPRGCPARGVF